MQRSKQLEYRRISTHRGVYLVPWNPGALRRWLESEAIEPKDFPLGPGLGSLIRDLLLVGVADEISTGSAPSQVQESPLSRLARALHSRRAAIHAAAG